MVWIVLAVTFLALSALDGWLTRRRLTRFVGLKGEKAASPQGLPAPRGTATQ